MNWRWEDDQNSDLSFVNWDSEPTDWRGSEHCGEIEKDGVYNDARCESKRGYICKTTNTGTCPKNWISNSRDLVSPCYYFSTRAKEDELNWDDARLKCQSLSPGADLLSVTTQEEHDFIKIRVMHFWKIRMTSDGWWTGLNRADVGATWYWGEGNPVSMGFIDWNQEPNSYGSKHFCARFFSEGAYEDEDCNARQPFICQAPASGSQCPPNWLLAGSFCHLLVPQPVNWYAARQWCKSNSGAPGATLAKITSQPILTQLSLQLQVSNPRQSWWTALNDEDQGDRCFLWFWGEDEPAKKELVQWTKEPQNLSGNQHCGLIAFNGVYMDYDCDRSNGFICKYQGICPDQDGWFERQGYCYYISSRVAPDISDWATAASRCQVFNPQAKLLWVSDDAERIWIRDIVGMATVNSPTSKWVFWWTGLNDLSGPNMWMWNQDGPADMTVVDWNMEPNEFAIPFRGRYCASIHKQGTFHEKGCSSSSSYICSMNEKPQAGPIAGIAVGTIIGIIALGIAIYFGFKKYYQKKDGTSDIPFKKDGGETSTPGFDNQNFSAGSSA
ncbi:unnamed protein product [Owenia fusiformis]|uniref:Uncharacterized protein n=1 Tax=Owenia fusiformis TaxID=6347 RepID=A0A8J1XUI0_OWEFU|nr:unnamed protein product [Owenia fusiformis]